jgi:hypothetical protein
VHNYLNNNNNPKFQIVLLNSVDIKINAEEEKDYRDITRALNQTKTEWYLFENKLTRPIKVMATNIRASCTAEDVMKDLQKLHYYGGLANTEQRGQNATSTVHAHV